MSKGKFHQRWQVLMGVNLHNQWHSVSPGVVTWGVRGRRERKRVQAIISGGKLGKNMFRIWSLPMKLAAMHLNIHLVVLFHVNKERNSLFKLLFCKKRSWVWWVITQGELIVYTFFVSLFWKIVHKEWEKKLAKYEKEQDRIFPRVKHLPENSEGHSWVLYLLCCKIYVDYKRIESAKIYYHMNLRFKNHS